MTTPPTPAGWYPDPESEGGLRYWDGSSWTEHRSPAHPPAEPEPAEPTAAAGGGAHRAPDPEPTSTYEPTPTPTYEAPPPTYEGPPSHEPEPTFESRFDPVAEPTPVTDQPTTKVPLRDWSASSPSYNPTPNPSYEPPLTEQPTTKVPLRDWQSEPRPEPAPYADATTSTPPGPPEVEPPAGTEPPAGPADNRRLIMGFSGAVAALLLLLALAAVYAFVIHKDETIQLGGPASSETSTTTTETQTSTTEPATPTAAPPTAPGASGADGPMNFTVTGVESGTSITDPNSGATREPTQGEFIVVHVTVQNTSQDQVQFVDMFQKLNAAGQQYVIDDVATAALGGPVADVPPGGSADVSLAFDVPAGTVPETVELHSDPISPGVQLPLA